MSPLNIVVYMQVNTHHVHCMGVIVDVHVTHLVYRVAQTTFPSVASGRFWPERAVRIRPLSYSSLTRDAQDRVSNLATVRYIQGTDITYLRRWWSAAT